MIDPKSFDDTLNRLLDALPAPLKALDLDLKNQFKQILEVAFAKLDVVSREEFDIQTKVLAKTRQKLDELAVEVKRLEQSK